MKKTILVLLAVFLVAGSAFSQEMETRNNVIKVNPAALLFGGFNVTYERAIADSHSFELGLSYSSYSGTVDGETTKVTGLGFIADYRWYFGSKKIAPDGVYISPRFTYASTGDGDGNGVSTLGFGGVIGYQWLLDSGFDIDLFGGAQKLSITSKGDFSGLNISGVLPIIGLSLGFGF